MGANERIILGIDPGTNIMGYGIICEANRKISLVSLGVLKLANIDDAALKLKKIFETMLELIDKYHPDEMAIEAPFFGKNVQSMLKLGRAQGVSIAAALYRNIPIAEYSPRKVKQSITGKGAASKEQVSEMILRLLNIQEKPAQLDATDALAVAMCHYFQRNTATDDSKYSGWESFLTKKKDRIIK